MNIEIKTIPKKNKIKQFRSNGKKHWKLGISLATTDGSDLPIIKLVEYELHRTFKERFRYSSDRSSNFGIEIWSYGYFEIKAKLHLEDGSIQEISGNVAWNN